MTPTEKLDRIKRLLPENPSTITMDIETVRLITEINEILEEDEL